MLKIAPQTLRNAIRRAIAREDDGASLPPREAERDAALRDIQPTPGGQFRWSREGAARVLRAFGRSVPKDFLLNAAGAVAAVVAFLLLLSGCMGKPFIAFQEIHQAPDGGPFESSSSSTSTSGGGGGGTGGEPTTSSSSSSSSSSTSSTSSGGGSITASSSSSTSTSSSSSSSSGSTCPSADKCVHDADCAQPTSCMTTACVAGCCTSEPAPTSKACDDGDACTQTDHCDGAGSCMGTPYAPYYTFWAADPNLAYPAGQTEGACVYQAFYCSVTGPQSIAPPAAGYTSGPSGGPDATSYACNTNVPTGTSCGFPGNNCYEAHFCKSCKGDCATACP